MIVSPLVDVQVVLSARRRLNWTSVETVVVPQQRPWAKWSIRYWIREDIHTLNHISIICHFAMVSYAVFCGVCCHCYSLRSLLFLPTIVIPYPFALLFICPCVAYPMPSSLTEATFVVAVRNGGCCSFVRCMVGCKVRLWSGYRLFDFLIDFNESFHPHARMPSDFHF